MKSPFHLLQVKVEAASSKLLQHVEPDAKNMARKGCPCPQHSSKSGSVDCPTVPILERKLERLEAV